ncbi:TPA: WxL protein peptidoglycan domain-containing protein [Listeria monocytogenes]|uniref:WxL protein peptidoglycan domain-containing protein n=1 Tax=Listeria innocua TaxID=1642 RepID=UPI0019B13E7F|nr:DUF916 domain-containing protein [Listeria innocua]EGB0188251.1 DUF916 domain-containing protein [Listeria monocytogenes]EGB2330016.1 DUF916 domain-containing protein [Listeria monocytogenes]EGN8008156.1 DUF916 domain-containing protein [Listeria monocytogenes]UCK61492.1 DUF916 domain-containing protein [Listeria innocua]HEE1756772.1 DUF916 domain-containing protein [Listeria monocytogenes]
MKQFRNKHVFSCVLVFLLLISGFGEIAKAAETPTRDLAVTPLFSSHQKKNVTNYFSVSGTGKQTFQARVTNTSKHTKTIQIELTDAISTQTGIQYTKATKAQIKPAYALTSYSKHPKQTVTLQPSASKIVSVSATIPKDLEGTILGGIHYYEVSKNKSSKTEGSNHVSVHVHYQRDYVLAVAIHASPQKAKDAFYFQDASYLVYPSGSVVKTIFTNEAPAITGAKQFTYRVTKRGRDTTLFQGSSSEMKAAPMTTGYFEFSWGAKSVRPGNYTIHFYENKKEVAFRDFTIPAAKVEQLAKQNNQPIADITPWWVIVLYMIAGAVMALLLFYISKKVKAKQAKKNE